MMARSKPTEDSESVDNKEKVIDERPAPRGQFTTAPAGRGWLYGAAAVIVLALVFLAGAAAANHRKGYAVFRTGGPLGAPAEAGFGLRHRTMGAFDSNSVPVNGQSRLNGVVTSVNGNNFTVAGNGATTNVTTNSSTTYQDGNQVKQNDSVVVFGTTSNGTLTATRIIINP